MFVEGRIRVVYHCNIALPLLIFFQRGTSRHRLSQEAEQQEQGSVAGAPVQEGAAHRRGRGQLRAELRGVSA